MIVLGFLQPLALCAACYLTKVTALDTTVNLAGVGIAAFCGVDVVRHRVERSLEAAGNLLNWFIGRLVALLFNPTMVAVGIGLVAIDRFRSGTVAWTVIGILLLSMHALGAPIVVLRWLGGFAKRRHDCRPPSSARR